MHEKGGPDRRIESTAPLTFLTEYWHLGTWSDDLVDWDSHPTPEQEARKRPHRIEVVLRWPPTHVMLYALEAGHRIIREDLPEDALLHCIELIEVNFTTPRHYAVSVQTTIPGPPSRDACATDSLPRSGGGLSVFVGAWQSD